MNKIYCGFLLLFITTPILANVIKQNTPNGCDAGYLVVNNNQANIYARWKINSYTCSPGYYLPANAVECAKCPVDHTCPGGTYTFNENISQGIRFNSILTTDFAGGCVNDYLIGSPVKSYAIWQRNTYNCDAGRYLPADGIECELCPADNYCPGGKYEYSETVPQGIMECPDGLYSAAGMGDIASCGRKFHIGDSVLFTRSVKQTVPSLNFDFNGDGVADFFLNLTTTRTHMNATSSHYLHVGNYYIYDDTVSPGE